MAIATRATPVRAETPRLTHKITMTSISWKAQVQLKWKNEDALQRSKDGSVGVTTEILVNLQVNAALIAKRRSSQWARDASRAEATHNIC